MSDRSLSNIPYLTLILLQSWRTLIRLKLKKLLEIWERTWTLLRPTLKISWRKVPMLVHNDLQQAHLFFFTRISFWIVTSRAFPTTGIFFPTSSGRTQTLAIELTNLHIIQILKIISILWYGSWIRLFVTGIDDQASDAVENYLLHFVTLAVLYEENG